MKEKKRMFIGLLLHFGDSGSFFAVKNSSRSILTKIFLFLLIVINIYSKTHPL
jgi:fumarate reductase subunit D